MFKKFLLLAACSVSTLFSTCFIVKNDTSKKIDFKLDYIWAWNVSFSLNPGETKNTCAIDQKPSVLLRGFSINGKYVNFYNLGQCSGGAISGDGLINIKHVDSWLTPKEIQTILQKDVTHELAEHSKHVSHLAAKDHVTLTNVIYLGDQAQDYNREAIDAARATALQQVPHDEDPHFTQLVKKAWAIFDAELNVLKAQKSRYVITFKPTGCSLFQRFKINLLENGETSLKVERMGKQ